ncbi:MAG: flagellar basal body-associated FliL family protein [Chthonomonas sp.]|nr:flagellar basal body-associated FliL family protein [Chthonomonas sp.]
MIVALVIGGGGYMKMSGGKKKKEEPKIELGAVVPLPKEVLVNLREQESYLRTEVSLHLLKGVDAKHFEEYFPAIQNAFIMRLSGLDLKDLTTPEDKAALKRVLAKDANDALHVAGFHMPGEEPAEEEDSKDKKKKKKHAEEEESTEIEYPEFDSDTGPILKIYFTSFATQ